MSEGDGGDRKQHCTSPSRKEVWRLNTSVCQGYALPAAWVQPENETQAQCLTLLSFHSSFDIDTPAQITQVVLSINASNINFQRPGNHQFLHSIDDISDRRKSIEHLWQFHPDIFRGYAASNSRDNWL